MKTYNLFKFTPLVALLLFLLVEKKTSNARVSQKKSACRRGTIVSVDQLANLRQPLKPMKNNIARLWEDALEIFM